MRLGQLGEQPGIEGWLAHAVVREDRVVVGDAGFHGPPDDAGMVEVGYTIFAEHRRQGHARAALARLIELATERGVTTVRASVGPWNAPSLALVRSFGFVQVGEQMDDVDGLELVLERPA